MKVIHYYFYAFVFYISLTPKHSTFFNFKNGNAGLLCNDLAVTNDLIAGVADPYVSNSKIDDNMLHQIGIEMCISTDMLPNNSHMLKYQNGPYGAQYYSNKLWKQKQLKIVLPNGNSSMVASKNNNTQTPNQHHGWLLNWQLTNWKIIGSPESQQSLESTKTKTIYKEMADFCNQWQQRVAIGILPMQCWWFFDDANDKLSPGMLQQCLENMEAFNKTTEVSKDGRKKKDLSDFDEDCSDIDLTKIICICFVYS